MSTHVSPRKTCFLTPSMPRPPCTDTITTGQPFSRAAKSLAWLSGCSHRSRMPPAAHRTRHTVGSKPTISTGIGHSGTGRTATRPSTCGPRRASAPRRTGPGLVCRQWRAGSAVLGIVAQDDGSAVHLSVVAPEPRAVGAMRSVIRVPA
jgi:hypothetical protein